MRYALKSSCIKNCKRAIANLDQAVPWEFRKHFADVNWCQPDGIGDVLLAKREFHFRGLGLNHASLGEALRETQDETGYAFISGPPPEIDDELIRTASLFDLSLPPFVEHIGTFEQHRLQLAPPEVR